jgi:type IV pilus assembly protein PilB
MSAAKLGELLMSNGLISDDQLEEALQHKKEHKGRLGSSLINLGHINEKVLATFLSKQYGIPAISLDGDKIPSDLVKLIPQSLCERHLLIPISKEENRLNIAVADPTNVAAVDDVRFICNLDVNVFIAPESAIKKSIDRAYGGGESPAGTGDSGLRGLGGMDEGEEHTNTNVKALDFGAIEKETHNVESGGDADKPVIRLINKLFVEAIKRKASDIHIEPFESFSRVRLRVDGALHEVMKLPPQLRVATPSRIKVMASLDISEKRLPQDGRIQVRTKERKIDVRVSILPTIFGEKVVMRLLDQGSSSPDMSKVGFEEDQLRLFRKAAMQPYGMVLVTGPTGSGKSTTLYAALSELNVPDVNISTVEDPVEYNMAGVNQVQMKESIGMTFASALRSLLRQDPDIIMVGEIRDQETAEIAIKASLTGHMVFSTLHTNDAPSTVTRLLHMGIEPFLITASLSLVQAQRLLRVNCPDCNAVDPQVTKEQVLAAEMPESWMPSFKAMRGKGCDRCGGTGYRGRRGIFEVMYMTERLREMVVKGANADQMKAAAMEEGMLTLRQHGLLKLYRGETTLEEVLNNSRPDGDITRS